MDPIESNTPETQQQDSTTALHAPEVTTGTKQPEGTGSKGPKLPGKDTCPPPIPKEFCQEKKN